MRNLHPSEYNPYYTNYINLVESLDIVESLLHTSQEFVAVINAIPVEKHNYAYQPGKWTVKELVSHIVDTERIFAYRALRIARLDSTPLAGYEEDDYVRASNANNRSLESILQEFITVRQATLSLFESFTDEMLSHKGTASNSVVSVRAIGFIIAGHCIHHQKVLQERYL
jgi:uncharacterized damage-inducible protein DinB